MNDDPFVDADGIWAMLEQDESSRIMPSAHIWDAKAADEYRFPMYDAVSQPGFREWKATVLLLMLAYMGEL